MSIRVGPVTVAVEGINAPETWRLDPTHPRFFAPEESPDLLLTSRAGSAPVRRGQVLFRLDELASIWRDGPSWIFALGDAGVADRTAVLDAGGRRGTLFLNTELSPELASGYPLAYPLEDLLFRHLLPGHGAVIVHAAGIAWAGQGVLFVGSSGAGKSTAARLWKTAGALILNDDRVIVESNSDGIVMHPTPWSGEYPEVDGAAVPLACVYLIRQGWPIAFEPIRSARAVGLLFAKSFPPVWDAARVERTLAVLETICRNVTCGWLTLPPDRRAVEWVCERLPQ